MEGGKLLKTVEYSSGYNLAFAHITMYPPRFPYDEGFLNVSPLHKIYYMQCGNPEGKPVLFLHGGPGGSVAPSDTVYFNEKYRVILFSQRGAGKSEPTAELKDNTTWDLVSDIEKLREKLGIDKWLVFGGSWGSTLALAYAQTHPERCKGLILRGIFLVRRSELEFFYQNGTSQDVWPKEWDEYASVIPPSERSDIISAYYKRLCSPDETISLDAARAWSRWEQRTARLRPDPALIARADDDLRWARAFARIECHYFVNGGFMPDGYLIKEEQISKIRHLPCIVVQGRYDLVCPARSAWDLRCAWGDGMELQWVDDAGHSAREVGIGMKLAEAADRFYDL